MEEQLKFRIGLTLLPGVGDVTAKKLVAYCGGVEAIFKEKKSALLKIPGVGKVLAEAVKSNKVLDRAEQEILFIKKNGIKALFYLDETYPNRLKYCDDSPVMLYCKGNMDFSNPKVVSIVGTRNSTEYGKRICERLIEELVSYNVLVVSGLAYGIDICAHKAALNHNLPTVASLAHGLDRVYPGIHKSVAEKIQSNGGLVSEFTSETNPDRENFPKRNRIIAGLADAVIVIEAGIKGGALITAEIANGYNRDVFAFPGRIEDTYSAGCNRLIKINKAALIESAKDLEYLMGWENKKGKPAIQKQLFVNLTPEEEIIVSLLKEKGTLYIDNLCLLAKFPTSKAAMVLLNLEFSGLVKALPGKLYQLN